jgi:hypothetical protein
VGFKYFTKWPNYTVKISVCNHPKDLQFETELAGSPAFMCFIGEIIIGETLVTTAVIHVIIVIIHNDYQFMEQLLFCHPCPLGLFEISPLSTRYLIATALVTLLGTVFS